MMREKIIRKDCYHLLTIKELTIVPFNNGLFCLYQACLIASVKYFEKDTNEFIGELSIVSESKSGSDNEASRLVIQKFIDGDSKISRESETSERGYGFARISRDCLQILLPEPYLSLFESIFDKEGWSLQYGLTEGR